MSLTAIPTFVEADHETIALVRSGFADSSARGRDFVLYLIGRHIVGIRDDGTVFHSETHVTADDARRDFSAVVEAAQSTKEIQD